jgi:predicted XRE-type DNA-binding protein
MSRHHDSDLAVHDSSGNVFLDLGLPPETLLKARIALVISKAIKARKLTQAEAGRIMGVDQAKVSAIMNGKVTGYTLDRLFGFLQALGRDIDIKISGEHAKKPGRVRVLERAAL